MYSRQAWGGSVEPFILLKFLPSETKGDPIVAAVIYEYNELSNIGINLESDAVRLRLQTDGSPTITDYSLSFSRNTCATNLQSMPENAKI